MPNPGSLDFPEFPENAKTATFRVHFRRVFESTNLTIPGSRGVALVCPKPGNSLVWEGPREGPNRPSWTSSGRRPGQGPDTRPDTRPDGRPDGLPRVAKPPPNPVRKHSWPNRPGAWFGDSPGSPNLTVRTRSGRSKVSQLWHQLWVPKLGKFGAQS